MFGEHTGSSKLDQKVCFYKIFIKFDFIKFDHMVLERFPFDFNYVQYWTLSMC